MIVVKTNSEIEHMKQAGAIAAGALAAAGAAVIPGITTKQIDKIVYDYIMEHHATPSFLGYGGFPASACISVNHVVIHGIPDHTVLHEGDIVSVDVGAFFEGYHGDNAATFACGTISTEAQKLIDVTRKCFEVGMAAAVIGARIGDISHAIEKHAAQYGYGILRDFVGHGIGTEMHEDPQVPNYGPAGRGPRLLAGMTLAIEPMITQGSPAVRVLDDEWTVITQDGRLAAHHENTVAVTEQGPIILTQV